MFYFTHRLNEIISHEQLFADSYLFTSLSRQLLGQACRTSLFNPLLTALKERGKAAGSNLIFPSPSLFLTEDCNIDLMLMEYISNISPVPSSPYHEVLQNSQIESLHISKGKIY